MNVGVDYRTIRFGQEQDFSSYHHYTFQWIDDSAYFLDAEDELVGWSLSRAFMLHFRKKFAATGWSGEGKLGLLWLPPFCGKGAPSAGFFIVHVKRKHDGMSWIASRHPLHGLENTANHSKV